MRISDWSSDVCSSDLDARACVASMHALHDEAGGQPDVLQELGLRYTLLGLFADAERCHARAVELQSDAPCALYQHANTLIALGRLDEAEADLDRVHETGPGDGDAWYPTSPPRQQTPHHPTGPTHQQPLPAA